MFSLWLITRLLRADLNFLNLLIDIETDPLEKTLIVVPFILLLVFIFHSLLVRINRDKDDRSHILMFLACVKELYELQI